MSSTPILNPPVLMFAADHRWQWEEWCDAQRVDRARIHEVKALAADGFLLARSQSDHVRRSGALLIDPTYGAAEIARVASTGAIVGTPAERAGAFPLEWSAEPFERALTGSFVKVLIRHRPEHAAAIRDRQLAMLRTLQSWCRAAGKTFVLEVLIAREHEAEAEFEQHGRPSALADYIGVAYDAGVVPDYWKIEGVPDASAMRPIDAAIARREGVLHLVLGKNADFESVERWFAAVADAATAGGFAIGRTVYWGPAIAYLEHRSTRSDAVAAIAANYRRVVELWMHPHGRASLAR